MPGSVFKVIVAASALDNLEHISDNIFDCQGEIQTGSQGISCYGRRIPWTGEFKRGNNSIL